MERTNPLKSAQDLVRHEELASGFFNRSSLVAPVNAVCREFSSSRVIRVQADLVSKIVTPLMKTP